jgi:hypothetical protein
LMHRRNVFGHRGHFDVDQVALLGRVHAKHHSPLTEVIASFPKVGSHVMRL